MAGDIGDELHNAADPLRRVGQSLHRGGGAVGLLSCKLRDFVGTARLLTDLADRTRQLLRGGRYGLDALRCRRSRLRDGVCFAGHLLGPAGESFGVDAQRLCGARDGRDDAANAALEAHR